MFKKNKNETDDFVNKNFDKFMNSYINGHREDIKQFEKYNHPDFIDSERIIPYLLYRTFKSQEILNKVTILLVILTAVLVILTMILAYLTVQL